MSDLEAEEIDQADDEVSSIEEGKLLDYITDEPIKDTPKEQVRQRIARALFHEYGIASGWAGSPCSGCCVARRRPSTTICHALPLPIGPSAWPTRSLAHDHLH
jgi:hypothetical protein